ncbi:hypothetical protein [Sorangium sp. So ce1389]|uniref:hypothetical protein n=1 Tax=Sorangium sp. So ce1389 TaxID=3133336 RepID=UPI003F647DED
MRLNAQQALSPLAGELEKLGAAVQETAALLSGALERGTLLVVQPQSTSLPHVERRPRMRALRLTAEGQESIRAEPFDAVEFSVHSLLAGDEGERGHDTSDWILLVQEGLRPSYESAVGWTAEACRLIFTGACW